MDKNALTFGFICPGRTGIAFGYKIEAAMVEARPSKSVFLCVVTTCMQYAPAINDMRQFPDDNILGS